MSSDLLVALAGGRALLHVHPLENSVLAKALLDSNLRLHHLLFAFNLLHIREEIVALLRCFQNIIRREVQALHRK